VTPIAVTSAGRLPYVPDAPTVNEALGVNDYNWVVTRWIGVPKGTPADRKAYLAAGFNAAARDPELQDELRKIGAIPDPSIASPEQVSAKTHELAEMERQFYIRTGRMKP
jgi:tripartite-type tricarboxylate transporter receptor subunit TctC